jgi:phage repressor protein C with HTH and peptisase S24 domain
MPITVDQDNEPNIVLVPVKAQAGYAAGRVQAEFMQDLPTFTLPDPRFRNGTFRAFEVDGDSMEPTLYGNDIVVCRYIQDWRWLREMELYVIVMHEDVLVKRVRNRVREDQTLQLVSDNTFYPPMTIPVQEIQEVWQVHARLTLHLPAPRHHYQE